ncbi:MAG TPA: hypothetical protein VI643_06345, partial [Planctomycetota bacterium]|nr:hypothetical protein [Planctomycetota bacterium]
MRRTVPIFFVLLAAAEPEMLPHYSLRNLAVTSDFIAEAEPLDVLAGQSGEVLRFQISRVLKGDGLRAGQVIRVGGFGCYSFHTDVWNRSAAIPEFDRVLLFMASAEEDDEATCDLRAELSGIRLRSKEGRVFRPIQFMNPGPYYLDHVVEAKWDSQLKGVESDLAAAEKIRAIGRNGDAAARNRAILDWLQANVDDLKAPAADPFSGKHSWSPLDRELIGRVLKSRRPEDCWRAALLSEAINGWELDLGRSFATVESRKFLIRIIVDETQSRADRLRALRAAGSYSTLWPGGNGDASDEEIASLLRAAAPLLKGEDAEFRSNAADALTSAGQLHGRHSEFRPDALGALTEAYRAEPPGDLRNKLAGIVRSIGGKSHWDKVGGNRGGILVVINQFGIREEDAEFGVYVES